MNIIIHLRIVGVILILLCIMNLFVPRRFHWKEELSRVSLFNRQVFTVHANFIILTLFLFALLLLLCTESLLEPTRLARAILTGLLAFWSARMLTQWFVYSPAVWRGHAFFTRMHVLFSAIWIYFTATFAFALWLNFNA